MSDGQESTTGFFGDFSREPDGRPQNRIWLGTAVLFYALTAWGLLAESGGFVLFTPLFATGFALNGVAESLPAERQQAVYWTRVLATALMLVLFVVFLVGLLGGPELLR
jgi:hypothetical protein